MKTIRFNQQQVKAILAGDKTQHRMNMKYQPDGVQRFSRGEPTVLTDAKYASLAMEDPPERFQPCNLNWFADGDYTPFAWQYGKVGDFVYVKEECQIYGRWVKSGICKYGRQQHTFRTHESKQVRYTGNYEPEAENLTDLGWHSRVVIAMPDWACRIKLELTRHRIERLHDISVYDCMCEDAYGLLPLIGDETLKNMAKRLGSSVGEAKTIFAAHWDKVNQFNRHQWSKNDWVNVIDFKVVEVKTVNCILH